MILNTDLCNFKNIIVFVIFIFVFIYVLDGLGGHFLDFAVVGDFNVLVPFPVFSTVLNVDLLSDDDYDGVDQKKN